MSFVGMSVHENPFIITPAQFDAAVVDAIMHTDQLSLPFIPANFVASVTTAVNEAMTKNHNNNNNGIYSERYGYYWPYRYVPQRGANPPL